MGAPELTATGISPQDQSEDTAYHKSSRHDGGKDVRKPERQERYYRLHNVVTSTNKGELTKERGQKTENRE